MEKDEDDDVSYSPDIISMNSARTLKRGRRQTVEVDSSRSVSVDLSNHLIQLFLRDIVIQSTENVAEIGDVDVAVALEDVVEREERPPCRRVGKPLGAPPRDPRCHHCSQRKWPPSPRTPRTRSRQNLRDSFFSRGEGRGTIGVELLDELFEISLLEGLTHRAKDLTHLNFHFLLFETKRPGRRGCSPCSPCRTC